MSNQTSRNSLQLQTNDDIKTAAKKPPSKKQREECRVLGIPIKPGASSRDVWEILKEAQNDPKNVALLNKHYAYDEALMEDDDREEYGNALVDERNKWEALSVPGVQYLITYKKGKTLRSDIVELDCVEIEDAAKPYVRIEALLPKVFRKPRDGGSPYLEWDKDTVFRPKQILEYRKLDQPIDMFDVDSYDRILQEAKEVEEKYLTKEG